jgi:outer membrane biosynthesis protein TonB
MQDLQRTADDAETVETADTAETAKTTATAATATTTAAAVTGAAVTATAAVNLHSSTNQLTAFRTTNYPALALSHALAGSTTVVRVVGGWICADDAGCARRSAMGTTCPVLGNDGRNKQ